MQKKQDIIQAAEQLFYRNGFHATSTDRICSEAGVSTRTLYKYFPSREMLTEAVMTERKNRFFSALYAPQHPQAISQLFTVLEQWMQEQGSSGCFFLKAWGEYAEQDVRLSAQALDYRYQLREYIATCVRHSHGADSVAIADAIWMLSEGAITSALIIGPAAASHAAAAVALLLAGSGKKP
ncbi:TetR/AcrR family transcriptional regulator [Erwiniaceae bacterium BAC15a-03b]|uniref:TetR/AcrR family transcriptional regulator n=1 Tax=Winslowiella arboricola TaxID=2978220 RepID=A0A9J6PNU1_9GAMM|nr:TetR/AcrR family transcriptional regulator [Winslowiella arboricola]MCU5772560.1 TetR/AcrR family transcriptional regulator [Winslowiella arboricola]MCU5779082.1 TetR/AcrR family transcriptional regulator [Winslowiella arboricola]